MMKRFLPKSLLLGSLLVGCAGLALTSSLPSYAEEAKAAEAKAAPAAAIPAWKIEHDKAVKYARSNKNDKALGILEQLHDKNPGNLTVTRDYLLVLSWDGQDEKVISLYETMGKQSQPDFVIDAVGRAYRNLQKPDEALNVYHQALKHSPGDPDLIAGEIRSMADNKETDDAEEILEKDQKNHGRRVPVLLAASYLEIAEGHGVEALRYCDEALQMAPNSRDAKHERVIALERMGAPQQAREYAEANPGVIDISEYHRLEGDEAAQLVRWGPLEPPSEAERYAVTDKAIATLDQQITTWSKLQGPHAPEVLRARFDRLVALQDRSQMKEVVADYEAMQQEGIKVPPYARVAAAEAYLYLKDPDKAVEIYKGAVEEDPQNADARVGLFYAEVEVENFDEAYNDIDTLQGREPVWIRLKGLPTPLPNPERDHTDIATVYARLYGEDLEEAEKRAQQMVDEAPNNARYRAILGSVDETRGWPRLAEEQYGIGISLMQGKDVENEAGRARANFDLQNFLDSDNETQDLMARFPENKDVQRADRLEDVHNKAELDITADRILRGSSSAIGGSGYGIGTTMYSPPIDYNWRLFAGELLAHEDEPNNEGSIGYSRSKAGAEYRDGDVTTSLAGTYNHYKGTQRAGAEGTAEWMVDDYWTLEGAGELFAHDIPLRALNSGVTANAGNAAITYRDSERQELRLSGETMAFSDGNFRINAATEFTQRLLTWPHLTVDGVAELAGEQNSATNETRLYYNPKHDGLGTIGLNIGQILYRRYETIYDHRLTLTPGAYWEQGYGVSQAFTATYEQRLRLNDVFDVGAGVSYSHQNYDGAPEDTISLMSHLNLRFP